MQALQLTSARFFAAFYVVIFHTWDAAERLLALEVGGLLESFVQLGYVSVGFFFVLSGFILGKVYGVILGKNDVRRYFVARVARIYPLYIFSLVVDIPRLVVWRVAKYGLSLGILLTGVTFFGQVFMLQAWIPQLSGLNFPSWSLSTEMFFYLAYPFIAPIALQKRGLAALFWILLFLWLVRMFVPVMIDWGGGNEFIRTVVGRNPLLRLPDFVSGIILCQVDGWFAKLDRRRARYGLFSLGVLIVIIFTLVIFVERQAIQRPTVEATLLPCFLVIVLLLARCGGPINKMLSTNILVLLGESSYALYLLHIPIWQAFNAVAFVNSIYKYLCYLIVVIGLSILSFFLIERPMRNAIREWPLLKSVIMIVEIAPLAECRLAKSVIDVAACERGLSWLKLLGGVYFGRYKSEDL